MKNQSIKAPYKLWGKINQNLPAGDYFLHSKIFYDADILESDKEVIITGGTD